MPGLTFETAFADLPPFPSDVPTAPLRRLSLQKLIENDKDENDRLWEACTRLGFFYLDLRDASGIPDSSVGSPNGSNSTNGIAEQKPPVHVNGNSGADARRLDGSKFLRDVDRLFEVSKEFFELPTDDKALYDLSGQGSYFGYKGYGKGIIDKEGTKDRTEFYNVVPTLDSCTPIANLARQTSKDDILGLSEPLPSPPMLRPYRSLFSDYMIEASSVVNLVLMRINSMLHLPRDAQGGTLSSLHRLYARSGDQVRFVRSPPQPMDDRQVALGAHTDFGSITVLFNKLGGLQVFPPPGVMSETGEECKDWMYVRPLPGHCIINLGDAMVKFSAGVLRSATHRVVNPPGEEQGQLVRYSLVYFARPEDDVTLKALKGKGSSMIDDAAAIRERNGETDEAVSAKEWTLRRALGRRGVGNIKYLDGTETTGSTS